MLSRARVQLRYVEMVGRLLSRKHMSSGGVMERCGVSDLIALP